MIKNIIVGIVLIGIILLVSGCTDSKQFYVYETNLNKNLTLYPDGIYKMQREEYPYEMSGNYINEDDEIILKVAFGSSYTLKRQGDKLVDKDGDAWIRR